MTTGNDLQLHQRSMFPNNLRPMPLKRHAAVTRACSIFLLVLGVLWALGFAWFYLVMSGITDFTSRTAAILYWPVTLAAPLMLILGSTLLLRNQGSKVGAWLSILGAALYTMFALYNSAEALRPLKPLEPARAY
jgi:uncharacterized membrane protein YwaF